MPQTDKTLRQLAAEKIHGKGSNPSQLGDPISLKAEASDSEPTDQDRGAAGDSSIRAAPVPASSGGSHEEKMIKGGKKLRGMLREGMENQGEKENRTMMGDPTSLKAERRQGDDPVEHDNGPSGRSSGGSKL